MRTRIPSLLLAAVVVLVGVLYVWPEDEATGVDVPTLIDLEPAAVRQIVVEDDQGRRAELVNEGDSQWEPQKGTPSVDRTLMFDVEDRLFPLRAYRRLDRLDVDDPAYGLDRPEIIFTVESAGGRSHVVELGAQTFNTGGFYARVVGSDVVYLVPRRPMDDLRSLAAGERIDTPTRVDEKLREVEQDQLDKLERSETSPWLEQVLETGGEAARSPSKDGPVADVEDDVLDEE